MKDFKFNIFGEEYKVSFKDSVEFDNCDFAWGVSDAVYKQLEIAENYPNGDKINKEEIIRTILHELLHIILDEGMYLEEGKNEALVEWVGKCLYDTIFKQKIFDKIK
jgi:hypothetical protein